MTGDFAAAATSPAFAKAACAAAFTAALVIEAPETPSTSADCASRMRFSMVAPVARSFVLDVHLHGRDASVRNGDPDRNRAHAMGFARKTAVRGRSVSRGKRHRRAEHGETERLPHIDAFLLASLS